MPHCPASFCGLSEISWWRAALVVTETKLEIHDAQHSSRPHDPSPSGLLARADLLHLDADTELLGENFDQFAEIHALVGDVVKNSLDFVALVFDVADLHVESQFGRNLPRADHRRVLERDGLLPLLDVARLRLAVDLFELAVERVEADALHLACDQVARERDDADVVARGGLHRHDVARFERQVVYVAVETFARIFEAYLENVVGEYFRHAFEPVGRAELVAARANFGRRLAATAAERAAASHVETAVAVAFGAGGSMVVVFRIHVFFRSAGGSLRVSILCWPSVHWTGPCRAVVRA